MKRAPLKVIWKRHRTPTSILRAFLGMDPKEVVAETTGDGTASEEYSGTQMLGFIRGRGCWAFVETKAKPPVVHWWRNDKASDAVVAMMLGHELGHVTGKPIRGRSYKAELAEEVRADDYGEVAMLVWKKMQADRRA